MSVEKPSGISVINAISTQLVDERVSSSTVVTFELYGAPMDSYQRDLYIAAGGSIYQLDEVSENCDESLPQFYQWVDSSFIFLY